MASPLIPYSPHPLLTYSLTHFITCSPSLRHLRADDGHEGHLDHGGAGHDVISGGKDNDILFGDTGADLMNGNLGNDTIHGGAGDSFLKYCVTANGNITLFQTPVGHEHIATYRRFVRGRDGYRLPNRN